MKTRRDLVIGTSFGIVAALGYALTAILVRRGVADLAPPLVGATISLSCGAVILGLNTARSPESALRQKKSAIGFFLISGVIAGIGISSHYLALSLAPVVLVIPVSSTSPIFALLWSHIFLGQLERITPRIMLGAIFVVIGAILISIGREV